jgi:hypothetical protein
MFCRPHCRAALWNAGQLLKCGYERPRIVFRVPFAEHDSTQINAKLPVTIRRFNGPSFFLSE